MKILLKGLSILNKILINFISRYFLRSLNLYNIVLLVLYEMIKFTHIGGGLSLL